MESSEHVGSTPLTYGQIVALGGDFYGTPDLTPISGPVVGAVGPVLWLADQAKRFVAFIAEGTPWETKAAPVPAPV